MMPSYALEHAESLDIGKSGIEMLKAEIKIKHTLTESKRKLIVEQHKTIKNPHEIAKIVNLAPSRVLEVIDEIKLPKTLNPMGGAVKYKTTGEFELDAYLLPFNTFKRAGLGLDAEDNLV